MPYLNVQETNSLMELLTLQFPLRCERITFFLKKVFFFSVN